jgi:hypothetical protein
MYNPLLGDPSHLKDSELEAKINELSRKYSIACRTGMNDVVDQLIIAIEMYRNEMVKRNQDALKKSIGKANGDLDGLINIE